MYDVSMTKPAVSVRVARTSYSDQRLPLPSYQTEGASGMDVRANLIHDDRERGITVQPGERKLIPTGLIMDIPAGYEIQVRPRSGLALKSGLMVANSPGTVDSDYRGEVGVIVINLGTEPFLVGHGDRIAQFVLAPVTRCEWVEAENVSGSIRGSGGFGSTGV